MSLTLDIPGLHSLVNDSVERPAVEFIYPISLRRSLMASLRDPQVVNASKELSTELASDIERLTEQLSGIQQLGKSPLIAVSGLLNAGKSSLVASFLSPENRKRVLTGTGNSQGTHRFVIWLPESWKSNPTTWQQWLHQVATTFGKPVELLSSDPAIAFAQYNGQSFAEHRVRGENPPQRSGSPNSAPTSSHDLMNILSSPLVATDPRLDRLGLGLMECPDIQTGIWGDVQSDPDDDSPLPEQRRKLLATASRLCSAFVIVTKLRDLHDLQAEQLLTTLREQMPGLPRILAVNFAKRRYRPSEILGEAKPLIERFGLSRVYAAYDFRGPEHRERLPPKPDLLSDADDELTPLFFRIDKLQGDVDCPAPTSSDYLITLGSQLDQGELVRQWRQALERQLVNSIDKSLDLLDKGADEQRKRIRRLQQSIFHALVEFSGKRSASDEISEIRLQTSRQIVSQIAESLQRTAPWWAWPSLVVDRTVAWTKNSIASAAKSISPVTAIPESLQSVRDWFRRGDQAQIVNSDRLRRDLKREIYIEDMPDWSDSHWLERCQRIIDRFQLENETRLEPEQLDRWAEAVWAQMPLKRKLITGLMPVAPIFAPLAAVILIPFDFGGSAVLVFASLKELLAAATIAGAWAAISGGQTPIVAENEAAWQQLSDLAALTCDELGLPRATDSDMPTAKCGGQKRTQAPSQLATRIPTEGAMIAIWKVNRGFVAAFDDFRNAVQ